jgi:hypothetical protein
LSRGKGVARRAGKSVRHIRVRPDAEPIVVKWMILCCREKPLAMFHGGPYPKPTQVVR